MNNKTKIIILVTLAAIALMFFFWLIFLSRFEARSLSHENGTENVPVENFVFVAEFSHDLDSQRTPPTFVIDPATEGELVVERNKIIFKASQNLLPLTRYKISFAAYKAGRGAIIADEIEFVTSAFGTPPAGEDLH